jgi:FMN reductase
MPDDAAVRDGRPGPVVVGLGGSTRAVSLTTVALRAALDGAARAGARTQLLDLRALPLPILDADRPVGDIDNARTILDAVRGADGLIVASPLYQQTISGAMKNLLDYLGVLEDETPPGLTGKVVGLVSVAGGAASLGATLAMRASCNGMGAWVLPDSADLDGSCFDADGRLCNLLARDRLRALGKAVTLGAVASNAGRPTAGVAGDRSLPGGHRVRTDHHGTDHHGDDHHGHDHHGADHRVVAGHRH